jgi:type IV secretory pathway VirB3-like protein
MEMNFNGYPVFKGLQKPLEFMGIRGRFLTYAAMVIGISFIGYILFSILVGKLARIPCHDRHCCHGHPRYFHQTEERTAQ